MAYRDPADRKAYLAAYYLAHREESRAYNAAYHAAHRDEVRVRNAARRAAHPEECAAAGRAYYAAHRDALIARQRAYNATHREGRRRQVLRRQYGLTPEAFAALLAGQGGRCAICGTDTPNGKGWCVDHDHETDAVRGVLCNNCNTVLGHAHDDVEVLAGAIAYLTGRTHD